MNVLTPTSSATTDPVVAGRADAQSPVAPMRLTGTLRQRGVDLYLEQQMPPASGRAGGWTTPRLYLLLATPTTEAAARTAVDCPVTVTGSPSYVAARHRMLVALDSVEPLGPALSTA